MKRRAPALALVSLLVLLGSRCTGSSGDGTGGAGTSSPGAAGTTGSAGTSGGAGTTGTAGTTGAAGSNGTGVAGSNGTGAAGTSGGAGAGATGAAGTTGAAGNVGSTGGAGRPGGGCTDAVLRTAPPAGKESFKAEPTNAAFPFSKHWIGSLGGATSIGITGMSDYDHDGDLDFSSGQPGGPMHWWEYCSPDHWVQHAVGTGHNSPGGGNAADVDGDGWEDLIAGDSWYRNPKTPRTSTTWSRFPTGVAQGAEDIAVGDVSGDGKVDMLFVWNPYSPQWRSPGTDPTMTWPLGAMLANTQTQGGAIADLDGDKDNDIVVGNQWWYRNMDGKGKQWETVRILAAGAFDDSPLVNAGDIDGDGDMDLVMCTHFGSRATWVENGGGAATTWTAHPLATNKSKLHAIFALDFDNDGDLDVYGGESAGTAWIWENTDGKGTFKEHAVATNVRGHDARVGDVDCDGDLDIAGKPWNDAPADHVYLQNMTVERGGKAVHQRPAGEVWRAGQKATGCP